MEQNNNICSSSPIYNKELKPEPKNNGNMCKLETKDDECEDFLDGHIWLVMCGGKELKTQIFVSISKGCYDMRSILGMANKKVFSNWNEWFVLADYSNKECSLLNVISMEKVKLPIYDKMHSCLSCMITCSPEDPNCRVVFIDFPDNNMCICQPGDDKFREEKLQFPEGQWFIAATYFDRSIYILLYPSHSIYRVELNDLSNEFQTTINGESVQMELLESSCRVCLINSCGELHMVYQYRLHEGSYVFQVFRADFSTSKWVLLTSIGDRTIFLDSCLNEGISCSSSSSSRIKRNCIYYMAGNNDRTIYIFNMEDQSFTMTIPCPIIPLLDLTSRWFISHSNF